MHTVWHLSPDELQDLARIIVDAGPDAFHENMLANQHQAAAVNKAVQKEKERRRKAGLRADKAPHW